MNLSNGDILMDKWGRQMDYLRIAVTDRCNLRCFYCMPAEGINYLPKQELLTYEEILRAVEIFCSLGVKKVRITGGEPFLRKDIMPFLTKLKAIDGLEKLHITTNGVLTIPHIPELKAIGIDGINLSLDSLDKKNFHKITRRDEFDTVMSCLDALIAHDIPTKINMVVMTGQNTHEIADMAALTKHKNIHVRFIEEMPFNGSDTAQETIWNHQDIIKALELRFPNLKESESIGNDPAKLYNIPNHKGKIGIIPAFTRTFCGSCNRIRMTALGTIKNCLYDEGALNLRDVLRSDASNNDIRNTLIGTVQKKAKDGIIAEANRTMDKTISESMSTIGG